jgi:thioredoxin-like negative regulator of GroEL
MATLQELLNSSNQSVRLKAALAAGTYPNPDQIEILILQCANESDFFVRDTLSWALMRHDQKSVIEQLKIELESENPQARSQALHTLSKIGNKENYELITRDLLLDPDDFVASTAWRSASVLVSDNDKQALVELLISQLGRGDSDIQFGLTRFLCAIGQPIVAPLTQAAQSLDEIVRTHAEFTLIRFQEMELEKVKKK